MARFMLLIYDDPKAVADLDEAAMRELIDEYWTYDDELAAIGALVDSAPLQPAATARTVAPGGAVTDGPFAETAEPPVPRGPGRPAAPPGPRRRDRGRLPACRRARRHARRAPLLRPPIR